MSDSKKPSCIVCDREHEFTESVLCGSTQCEYIGRTINLNDDYVVNYIMGVHSSVAQMLVELAFVALNTCSKEDYKPCPCFLGETESSSYDLLKRKSFDLSKILTQIANMRTDYLIEREIGPLIYGWIRFSLKSNLLNIEIEQNLSIPKMKVFRVINKPVQQIQQRRFFHGSSYVNWYSIINNGLKNYSKTKKCVNGAAFGNGIYLSSESQLSWNYSQKVRNNQTILGVFSILDDCQKYHKGTSIYVVPDEKRVCIEYLIVGRTAPDFKTVDEMFSATIVKESTCQRKTLSGISNKRLMLEARYFANERAETHGIRCQFAEADMFVWNVFLSDFSDKRLSDDLSRHGLTEIELEVRFTDKFPFNPPFIRIVRPRFEYMTGHVTLGGSICIELLTQQGWNPTFALENILIQIKSIIMEGGGRIDHKRWNQPYSYEEATDSYKRMMLSHGWI
jgi:ubiquitin-protein ligase